MKNLNKLPVDLPIPVDDGACDHLLHSNVPSVCLKSVSNKSIDLSSIEGMAVIFFYPMNGRSDSPPMIGWNDIPGARGCTPQVCSFRDSYANLEALNVKIFAVSSQALEDQKEASTRLTLPFEILNDTQLKLTNTMNLPTFEYKSSTYIKRVTLITIDGVIKKVFYPVFPPDKNVIDVIEWVGNNHSL